MTLTKLRKLAEAATPGPWYIDCGVSERSGWAIRTWRQPLRDRQDVLRLSGTENIHLDEQTGQVEQDQEFITSFDPTTALTLLDYIKALEEEVDANEAVKWLEIFCKQDNTAKLPKALERKLKARAKRLELKKKLEEV